MTTILCDKAPMMLPTAKHNTQKRRTTLRPKMSERLARKIWVTALVRRYDVPIQKDCTLEAFNAVAMT